MAAYWICAVFTVISSCVSLGYSSAAVAGVARNERGARSHAEYAFSRSVALTAISVVTLFGERHDWLVATAVAMIVVQAADAVIGSRIPDRLKTLGPAMTAVVNLALLIWYVTR